MESPLDITEVPTVPVGDQLDSEQQREIAAAASEQEEEGKGETGETRVHDKEQENNRLEGIKNSEKDGK